MQDKTAGADRQGRRSREEIVLDGWLEDFGPYVKLEFRRGRRAGGRVPDPNYKVSRKADGNTGAPSLNVRIW